MLTTHQVSWREYLSEFLITLTMSTITITALFRAPSFFVHVISAVVFTVLFIIFRQRIITFGNPVVTIAMAVTRKISPKLSLAFLSLQMLAGTIAGLIVSAMTSDISTRISGISKYAEFSWTSLGAECLAGFLLVAALFSLLYSSKGDSNTESNSFTVFLITYSTMLFAALVGSLGFVNPAYTYTVQLYTSVVYSVAPIVGGALGALFYGVIIKGDSLQKIYKSHN